MRSGWKLENIDAWDVSKGHAVRDVVPSEL